MKKIVNKQQHQQVNQNPRADAKIVMICIFSLSMHLLWYFIFYILPNHIPYTTNVCVCGFSLPTNSANPNRIHHKLYNRNEKYLNYSSKFSNTIWTQKKTTVKDPRCAFPYTHQHQTTHASLVSSSHSANCKCVYLDWCFEQTNNIILCRMQKCNRNVPHLVAPSQRTHAARHQSHMHTHHCRSFIWIWWLSKCIFHVYIFLFGHINASFVDTFGADEVWIG